MTIRRARPKYLTAEMLEKCIHPSVKTDADELLYFDRGSSALRFLLEFIGDKLGRAPRVCIQSFNCQSVVDAALEAGAEVILCDIKLSDMSLPYSVIKTHVDKLDVVLLLHYQGRRNEEHREISLLCRENGIILVEDLAHCPDAAWSIEGDYGIYSYAFDKPFTCMHGGALALGTLDRELRAELTSRYYALPLEAPDVEVRDLRLLRYMFSNSAFGIYRSKSDGEDVVAAMQRVRIPDSVIRRLLSFTLVSRGVSLFLVLTHKAIRLVRKPRPRQVLRLRSSRLRLLQLQRERYRSARVAMCQVAEDVASAIFRRFRIEGSMPGIEWNRMSFLGGRDIALALRRDGIEASNFNWPRALNQMKKYRGLIELEGDYSASEHASANVVNVPVWCSALIRLSDLGSLRDLDDASFATDSQPAR